MVNVTGKDAIYDTSQHCFAATRTENVDTFARKRYAPYM